MRVRRSGRPRHHTASNSNSKGEASAIVSKVERHLLSSGHTFLFTDAELRNPSRVVGIEGGGGGGSVQIGTAVEWISVCPDGEVQ